MTLCCQQFFVLSFIGWLISELCHLYFRGSHLPCTFVPWLVWWNYKSVWQYFMAYRSKQKLFQMILSINQPRTFYAPFSSIFHVKQLVWASPLLNWMNPAIKIKVSEEFSDWDKYKQPLIKTESVNSTPEVI